MGPLLSQGLSGHSGLEVGLSNKAEQSTLCLSRHNSVLKLKALC